MRTLTGVLCVYLYVVFVDTATAPLWSVKHDYPPPRNGGTSAAINTTHMIFGFGRQPDEYNDVWILNAVNRRWSPVSFSDEFPVPRPRAFACGVVVDDGFYVFGGISSSSAMAFGMRDFWVLNLTQKMWFMVARGPRDTWPEGASHCTLVRSPRGVCLLMGTTQPYEFDLATEKWYPMQFNGVALDHRTKATCCAQIPTSDTWYAYVCYGGTYVVNASTILDSVILFNITSRSSSSLVSSVNSTLPTARSGAQCFVSQKRQFFVFSGHSVGLIDLQDEWKFDLNTRVWEEVVLQPPRSVLYTNMVKLSPQHILSFSGFSNEEPYTAMYLEIDDVSGAMTVVNDERPVPTPRFGAALFVMNDILFMAFGGTVQSTHLVEFPHDTAWSLDIAKNTWSAITPFDPAERIGTTSLVVAQQALIFFGLTGTQVTNDVLRWMPFEGNGGTIEAVIKTSPWPEARYFHGTSFLSLNQNQVVLFGGLSSVRRSLGDTWILDVRRNTWTLLAPSPALAQEFPRYQFGMGLTSLGIILFAGVNDVEIRQDQYVLNPASYQWEELTIHTDRTRLRRSGFLAFSHPTSSVMYVYGGQSDSEGNDDFIVEFSSSNSNNAEPVRVVPSIPVFTGARLCSSVPYRNRFIVFGCVDDAGVPLGLHMEVELPQTNGLPMCAPGSVGDACNLCPLGTFSLNTTACLPCPPGTKGTVVGSHGGHSCIPCEDNTYQPQYGQASCIPCNDTVNSSLWCPVGSTVPIFRNDIVGDVSEFIPRDALGNAGVQPTDSTSQGVSFSTLIDLLIVGIVLVTCYGCVLGGLTLLNMFHSAKKFESDDPVLAALRSLFHAMTIKTTPGSMSFELVEIFVHELLLGESIVESSHLQHLFVKHSEGEMSITFIQMRALLVDLVHGGVQLNVEKLGLAPGTCTDAFKRPPYRTLLVLDLYGGMVPRQLGQVLVKVQTHLGGVVSLFAFIMVIVVVFYYTADFVENNHVETRSVLPTILLPNATDTTGNTLSITMRYINVPSNIRCICDGDMFARVSSRLEFKSKVLKCTRRRSSICEISVTLIDWSPLDVSTTITFEALQADFRVDMIAAEVTTSTGGKLSSDISTSRTLLESTEGNVFRGMQLNSSIEVLLFPAVVQSYDGAEGFGHMNTINTIVIGQQTPPSRLSTTFGVAVTLFLNIQSQTGIRISRRDRISPIVFISNIVAIIPAVVNACGVGLAIYYVFRRKASSQDSKKAISMSISSATSPECVVDQVACQQHRKRCLELVDCVNKGIPYAVGKELTLTVQV